MRSATKQLTARTVQKSRSSCWRILPITFLQRLCCQRTNCSSSVHKGYDEPETLLDQIVKSAPKALTTDSLSGLAVMARHPAPVGPIATSRQCWLDRPAKNDLSDNGCCQTNEPKHQYSFDEYVHEVTKQRHSVRAASRFSLNLLRFERDLCELNRL